LKDCRRLRAELLCNSIHHQNVKQTHIHHQLKLDLGFNKRLKVLKIFISIFDLNKICKNVKSSFNIKCKLPLVNHSSHAYENYINYNYPIRSVCHAPICTPSPGRLYDSCKNQALRHRFYWHRVRHRVHPLIISPDNYSIKIGSGNF
jgi:hypothetical protein